ncbi:MAG TPA: hypothetical protein VFW28_16020 [Micropepsaceae bacterium]|nr:hypothetical protein [Micropepsaceae bacterium]
MRDSAAIAPPRLLKRMPGELAHRYSGWAQLEGLAFLFTAALVTAAIWWLLSTVNEWTRASVSVGRFYAGSFMWMFPSLTLGLFAGGIVVPVIFKWCLGQSYAGLAAYEDGVAGDVQIKANRFILGMLPIVAVITAVQIWNFHAFFGVRRIEIRELTDLSSHSYSYSDVAGIVTSLYTTAPNGRLVYGQDYLVYFRDGRTWGTHSNGYGLSDLQKQEIALFVSRKSGKPIREVKGIP